MIISQQVADADVEQMLEFYRQRFDTVDLVHCNKCGAFLCFELTGADPMGMAVDERGKIIVPIGDNMAGCRVRLDEAPNGERMVGYQCANLVKNTAFEQELAAWEKSRDAHEKQQDKTLNTYIDAHEKALKPLRAQYAKLLKKLGPGDAIPAMDMSGAPEYNPPIREPFTASRPQEYEACGNDTRMGESEKGRVPTSNSLTSLSPFEKYRIQEQILATGIKPHFEEAGNKKVFETFTVERVK